jgi:enoyl reductase-like protein
LPGPTLIESDRVEIANEIAQSLGELDDERLWAMHEQIFHGEEHMPDNGNGNGDNGADETTEETQEESQDESKEEESSDDAGATESASEGTVSFAEFKALRESNAAQASELAALRAERRHDRLAKVVANDGAPWIGETEANITMLEKYADAVGEDSEEFKTFVTAQSAAAQQLAEAQLFGEIGSSARTSETDAEASLRSMAEARRKEKPELSYEQAYSEVLATAEGGRLYQKLG